MSGRRVLEGCVAAFAALLIAGLGESRGISPELYQAFQFRHIGPPGNKTVVITGVAGGLVVYAGTPSGGVFKSDDGGDHWVPVFDGEDVASIGAIAVAPTDPNLVWVGTGDVEIRENVSIGNGIYMSPDGGATWKHLGLEQTGRIGRIVISPTDTNTVYVAALGRGYGPQQERGIFRTRDGGRSWQRVLFVDENTGGVDLIMSPRDPNVLFASMWELHMFPWGIEGGGPGTGIYISRDGGTSWNKLKVGLPDGPLGRIGLAISRSNPSRLYATIASAGRGNLWRSDDEGATWSMVSEDKRLNSRAAYYGRLGVFPDNPDELLILDQSLFHTYDGGKTFIREGMTTDQHDIWIDPANPSRLYVVNDRYIFRSTNRSKSWTRIGLPNAQMYHVATDNAVPYNVYGNRHDGWAFRGPSANYTAPNGFVKYPDQTTGLISNDLWNWIFGGETGWSVPDPDRPDVVWTSSYEGGSEGTISRVVGLRHVDASPPHEIGGVAARYFPVIPIVISSRSPRKIYVGSQYVEETADDGKTWRTISPDLTTHALPQPGGSWPGNVPIASAVSALAQSVLEDGVLWAGSTDGMIHVTRDGGGHWNDVTPPRVTVPPMGLVSCIQPSRYTRGAAYVTIDRHLADDRASYVLRTTDYGKTWRLIIRGIPQSALSYAHVILEDPVRKGLLYLGTENALYVSFSDGASWQPLQNNLPPAPVVSLTVQENFDDLVVATFGRGFQIMDDISPLQQLTEDVARSKSHLFPPRRTYKLQISPTYITADAMAEEFDVPASIGRDAPYGVPINYYLAAADHGEVILRIFDANDRLVRTLAATNRRGINRVYWNLQRDSSADSGRGTPGLAPTLVASGRYTAELTARGAVQRADFDVVDDPGEPH